MAVFQENKGPNAHCHSMSHSCAGSQSRGTAPCEHPHTYFKGDNISHLNTHAAHEVHSSSSARSSEEPWPCGATGNAEVEVYHLPFVSACPAYQVKPFPFFPCDINLMKVIIFLYQLSLAHTLRSSILFIQASLLSIHASTFLKPSSLFLSFPNLI